MSRGSAQEILEIICRAGEEKIIGTSESTELPCEACPIGLRFKREHCAFLEGERLWGKKDEILYSCKLLNKRNLDPDKTCVHCNDYELVR